MQFNTSKAVLLKAISDVNGAVEKKNTIPVLQNIKIEAAKGEVLLHATDMDILILSKFSCEVKSMGATTVPAQMLFDLVRKISDLPISVSFENDSSLQIKAGKSKYNLPCIDASEFPVLSEGELGQEYAVDCKKFAKIIDKTRFAISSDETRYYLNGLFLQSTKAHNGQEIRTVATDGHRLAISFFAIEALSEDFGIIIPRKSVVEIRKVIEGAQSIKIAVSRVKIKIIADSTTIISKLIDGEFPDYNRVIPKNNPNLVSLNRKIFIENLDRISTVANDKHRAVKLVIEQGRMELQVVSSDGYSAYEEMEIKYDGERIETGFNSRYLIEILNQIEKDELKIHFKDGFSPALIEAQDMNSSFVIMPVRV